MVDLPTGTVTLLFTDIEHSTQLLQRLGTRYGDVLTEYRALLRGMFQAHDGREVDTQGDSFFVAFPRAVDAVVAAIEIQRALAARRWPDGVTMATRMGLHTGEPQRGGEGYVGLDVHRAARIGAAGHGGQVLLSPTTRELVLRDLPQDVGLRDLGEHRLKDLLHPEHIFQLVIADLPRDFAPLTSLTTQPNNLPLQLTSFIGREHDVDAIQQRLLDPQVRLLTLTGPGGTGKTRLALQVAAELLDHFADGVWFVNLAPISDPARVLPTLAQVLGVQGMSGQPLPERLREVLRDQRLLLVLDNFEQVVTAAPGLTPVLTMVPGMKLLVTSRAVLHLSAEHTYPVAPLALPDPDWPPDLAALGQCEAVALFTQRARAATPMFAVTVANAPAVVEICSRLDGLPLALELAAARSRIFAPQALLVRLQPTGSRRLQLLTGGARDLPARQQTIRDTIAWSYSLLSTAEQRLFRRLAVFVGGWTVEAAEAVCDIDGDLGLDVLDGLTALVEQSLLRQVEGPDGEPRFRRLETIREYAVEQLAVSGETAMMQARHAEYYLSLAEIAAPAFRGPEQFMWLDRLEVEHPNLRAALEWSFHGGTREDGMRLAVALSNFWHLRGHYQEGDHWLTRLVANPSGTTLAVQMQGLVAAGWLAFLVSDIARGVAFCNEAIALSRLAEDRWMYAAGLIQLAIWISASDYAEEALTAAREAGDPWLVAAALVPTAYMLGEQGHWDRARTAFEASVAAFRRCGDAHGVSWALINLAGSLYNRGLYAEAEAHTLEALPSMIRMEHGPMIALCQYQRGQLAHARGDYARAAAWLAESLAGYRKAGHRAYAAAVLVWLGRVALAQADDIQALEQIDEGLIIFREIDDRGGIGLALQQAARVARYRGQPERATALLTEGIALIHGTVEWPFAGFAVLDDLGGLAAAQGDPARAARLFGAAEPHRSLLSAVRPPIDQLQYDRDVAAARAQLDVVIWNAAWAEGQAMTLEQAIAYALAEVPDG